jgi:hypothetical protein
MKPKKIESKGMAIGPGEKSAGGADMKSETQKGMQTAALIDSQDLIARIDEILEKAKTPACDADRKILSALRSFKKNLVVHKKTLENYFKFLGD